MGNIDLLRKPGISIVGTRHSSSYANELSYNTSSYFAKNNFVIVSGIAYGIDQSAHEGALAYNNTIGVVAGDIKNSITGGNFHIITKMLNNNCAIISEHFENTIPFPSRFLERNRLVATISEATIVIEAPIKSGSINTATIAITHDIPVFAIPWNLNHKNGEGCNNLFLKGAIPFINYRQILEKINCNFQISFLENLSIKKNKVDIPNEYLPYYNYIKKCSPVTEEDITNFFHQKRVSDISSSLTMLEINSFIKFKDNFYYID